MTTDNDITLRLQNRELQRDARAWQRFAGMKYTEALRLMQHPLAQGILGDRISARELIRVLTEHQVLVDLDDGQTITNLGENGLWSAFEQPLICAEERDFLDLVLTIEVLRMFTVTPAPNDGAHSYSLKHVAENFLGSVLRDHSYVSNGKLIWAAAALGLPLAESSPGERSLNANLGLNPQQVQYARGMNRLGTQPRAHHHRPPGYRHLLAALEHYAKTGETTERWNGVDDAAEPLTSPFHEWLIAQVDSAGERGAIGSRETLAFDYIAGIADSDHGVARVPEELLTILHNVGAADEVFDAARSAIAEWARTSSRPVSIRTERIYGDKHGHQGWGAGGGTVERYEYLCPCGEGTILEEHDNIPGFREHDVRLMCGKCSAEWQFVDGRATRDWRLEPIPADVGV
ncbi:hypothetical protein [Herbiconiux ginsengi]|uniref:Ribosomal protein S27AE n=1 Tax=Herbiconiux ginsengi TaxID=381665 RepID=A0A1H3RLL2_9MICO|nr:hypothetical protein [Herbiconiux ginsengi]SDZ26577.1 Ribosomal protein S27AE [Herbiconiux ginsengi]